MRHPRTKQAGREGRGRAKSSGGSETRRRSSSHCDGREIEKSRRHRIIGELEHQKKKLLEKANLINTVDPQAGLAEIPSPATVNPH
jgi:hypothetical protein